MSYVRSAVAALLVAALFAAPLAQAGAQGAPLSVDVTRATLPNGLQIVVLRDRLAPVVATYLNYAAGSDDEPLVGLAHAQEHMMFRGSATVDASQFSRAVAVTGGSFNADTQNDLTQYFFEVPSQDLNIALQLDHSRAKGLLDTQALWNQERGAITQEVTSDNSSASYRLYDKTIQHMFAGTPYADAGLGTVDGFKRITSADLKTFYKRWYHPNNATYVIAGDVDPQAVIAQVRALWSDIPAAPLPAHRSIKLSPLMPITLHDNSSDPVVSTYVAYRVPGFDSPDYFAAEILSDVLNSPRGALYALQADGKSLGTSAQSQTFGASGVSLVSSAVPVTTKGETAVADVEAVIDGYKKTGMPADLVAVAQQREVAQAQFALNSINSLAQTWSQSLVQEHRTPDDDLAGLKKVTVDDVNRVLRTYYDNATATVAIATPKDATGSAFGAKEGENNTIAPSANTQLPAFARNVLHDLHVPADTAAPVISTLSNGIKLVVVPSQISQTVTLRGATLSNGGVQDPPGKEGIDFLIDALFPYGTAQYDRIAYQTQLDAIAANVTAGGNFSLDVVSNAFERGVALLADDQLHPRFPADAFAIVKAQTLGTLAGQLASPDYKSSRALTEGLYPPGDPARRAPTLASVGSITLDDLKAHYAATYRPDLTTIVVVGDVTPQRARAAIESAFGDWHASGPTPDIFPKANTPNAASSHVIPATGRIQADVTLAQTLPIGYRDPAFPLLQLASTALSGGFYSSILAHDLRETHGYVYTVGSNFSGAHNRGTFDVNFGCDPKNIEPAKRLVINDLRALQRKPLSPERLLTAKALVIGALPIGEESTGGVAAQLLDYIATGRPYNQDRIDARAQLRASGEDVRAALAKYLRPADFVQVIEGPAR